MRSAVLIFAFAALCVFGNGVQADYVESEPALDEQVADGAAADYGVGADEPDVAAADLGPAVVGADGSEAFISNWNELSEEERAATMESVAANNAKRQAALAAEAEATEPPAQEEEVAAPQEGKKAGGLRILWQKLMRSVAKALKSVRRVFSRPKKVSE